MKLAPILVCLILTMLTSAAQAQEEAQAVVIPELEFSGYGELSFGWLNHGEDQTREGGAWRDSRLVFDSTRFVLKAEMELPAEFKFEAEIEFEHGGTGAALELEYEEFGEYEQEIEKGGEVILEEFYLSRTFSDLVRVRIGRFYTAVGLLSYHYRPGDLIASGRPESETTILPAVWDEMGADVRLKWNWLEATAQIINGLDSTGFSSQGWISTGHQTRFEFIRARGLAGVLRLDFAPIDGLKAGVSAYYGDTAKNRPKPDLAKECNDPEEARVASCGYVSAGLLILDAHFSLELGPIRTKGLLLWGNLENADVISARNRNLSNFLNVLRSEVAEQAILAWGELGVDVLHGFDTKWRVEPHLRFEYYDTMFRVAEGVFNPPRFERDVASAGVGADYDNSVMARLTTRYRWFGDSSLRDQTEVFLTTGFHY